ncbi:hypothetical protein CDLVIII_5490 [Clostridium sp. DL-VIII]|uniref:hypothetical protein n=1 Tax=Clostridium sp. DL-VIII TaxID=641107 RepID=UPI00023B0518|nr:hypothetical protein [Clostridium sp. DL-VIII]EHJ01964.1 hypothetical protein CDLVIII_5490 [Clostridium sp. DL-VIII]
MAKISENNFKGLNTEFGLQTCFFCDTTINNGGNWVGNTDIAVCVHCSNKLLDLLIDVLEDSNNNFEKLSIPEKANYINEQVIERLKHKQAIKDRNNSK